MDRKIGVRFGGDRRALELVVPRWCSYRKVVEPGNKTRNCRRKEGKSARERPPKARGMSMNRRIKFWVGDNSWCAKKKGLTPRPGPGQTEEKKRT